MPTVPATAPAPDSIADSAAPSASRLWIDLVDPPEATSAATATLCGLRLPTHDELSEIESSSRHFVENDAIYLSAVLMTADAEPKLTPVGFIVAYDRLVTLRYAPSAAFDDAAAKLRGRPPASVDDAFLVLIEAIVDAQADALERIGAGLETLSQQIFHTAPEDQRKPSGTRLKRVLASVGRDGDRLSKTRASLLTLGRIAAYVGESRMRDDHDATGRLAAVRDDLESLTRYQETLFNKTQFLLDAVLGFISIDQNDVIKVLTVVSVVGVPPTLIASLYGMNFKIMPELQWRYGYPYALALIALSVILPLIWFKKRDWF